MLLRTTGQLLVGLSVALIVVSCSGRDFVGPGATVDLAVFLVDGTSDEEIGAVPDFFKFRSRTARRRWSTESKA